MKGQSEAKFLNEVGKIYGNVEVLSFSGVLKGKTKYNCRCLNCDNISERRIDHVKTKPLHCKKCQPETFRKASPSTPFNSLYSSFRGNAKSRNLEFKLSKEEVLVIISSNCFYCGQEPVVSAVSKYNNRTDIPFKHVGLDRLDSNIGYIASNIVPCCAVCNLMKNYFTVEEFFNRIEKIYNKHLNKRSTTIP